MTIFDKVDYIEIAPVQLLTDWLLDLYRLYRSYTILQQIQTPFQR